MHDAETLSTTLDRRQGQAEVQELIICVGQETGLNANRVRIVTQVNIG